MERILIFIPMYTCQKQIPRVIEKIAALPPRERRLFSQVLIVDNRSPDGSVAAAAEAIRHLDVPALVVRNRENVSLGGSHKAAFLYAAAQGFDYVTVLHGDDQGDIRDLTPLLLQGIHRQQDALLGSRFLPESRLVGYSRFRIFGNHVFNRVVSACAGCRIDDLGAGLNLYRTAALKPEDYLSFPNDLTFNVSLLLYGIYAGFRFSFFPLSWREEDQVSNARLWKQSRDILRVSLRFRQNAKQLFTSGDTPVQKEYPFDIVADNGGGNL